MDFLRPDSQNGPGPVVPPVRVCYQLTLIDDRHIEIFVVVEHLHRAGLTDRPWDFQRLLPGNHGTGHLVRIHPVVHLQGQKPQRAEVRPVESRFQTFQGVMGFPAVGRTDVEDKFSLHLPGPRVFQFRLLLNRFPDTLLDGFGHIKELVGPLQGIAQKIAADSLHFQYLFQLVPGQGREKFQVLCRQLMAEIHQPLPQLIPLPLLLFGPGPLPAPHHIGTGLGRHGVDIAQLIGLCHLLQGLGVQPLHPAFQLGGGHGPVALVHISKK